MDRKILLAMALTVVLVGMLGVAIGAHRVKASATIYIRADGSIEGTTRISTVNNITYTFTDDITDSIIVQRNNIVIDGAGYSLHGTGALGSRGIDLTGTNNVTIKNLEVNWFFTGIFLWHCRNNTISGSNITDNDNIGIQLYEDCDHTTIYGNIITLNDRGIDIEDGRHTILHNSFITNTKHVNALPFSTNTWDNGAEGNYWDNYTGTDSDPDGIGDSTHIIDANNQDNRPLMGMFSSFSATSEFNVQTLCNSTISDFQFNGTAMSFNVTGADDTTGFCRLCIPTALMNGTYTIFVNGTLISYNLLPISNSTHRYLYFTYNHSTQEVVVIPESPTWASMFLLSVVLTVTTAIYKRRLLKTPCRARTQKANQ